MARFIFRLGPPVRPNIRHDNGFLDRFTPREPTATERAQYAGWRAALEGAESVQGVPFIPHNDLTDALAAYRHFLTGDGADRTFSYERYVANDASGRTTLANAIVDARQGAEAVYQQSFAARERAQFSITSDAVGAGGRRELRFPYPATENWQKAIGAHFLWIGARIDMTRPPGEAAQFTMEMTLHAEDRYNFNPENEDIATGVPDSANGIFEVTGLAHQYTNYSTLVRTVRWTPSGSAGPDVEGSPFFRQRQPDDNRRARNRL